MFEQEHIDGTLKFYSEYAPCAEIFQFRRLRGTFGPVDNLFYGDSITNGWQLHEFFPNHSILKRGIPGDSVYGLYHRMKEDVFPYQPKRVFMLIGINGIQEPEERLLAHITALAEMMEDKGIEVALSSILPLRNPDNWNRFQFQDKIVRINSALRNAAEKRKDRIFLDYHSAVRDETGQLAAECARDDGTHVIFEGYCRMAEVVRPHLICREGK